MDNSFSSPEFQVKSGLAKMLKGGVIMDVINVEQAKIAEAAGFLHSFYFLILPKMLYCHDDSRSCCRNGSGKDPCRYSI